MIKWTTIFFLDLIVLFLKVYADYQTWYLRCFICQFARYVVYGVFASTCYCFEMLTFLDLSRFSFEYCIMSWCNFMNFSRLLWSGSSRRKIWNAFIIDVNCTVESWLRPQCPVWRGSTLNNANLRCKWQRMTFLDVYRDTLAVCNEEGYCDYLHIVNTFVPFFHLFDTILTRYTDFWRNACPYHYWEAVFTSL